MYVVDGPRKPEEALGLFLIVLKKQTELQAFIHCFHNLNVEENFNLND